MELEDYFDFDVSGQIRIRGTPLGVETILLSWLEGEYVCDLLRRHHPAVTLEQLCATVTYYLHNKTDMDAYLQRRRESLTVATNHEAAGKPLTPTAIRALRAHGLQGYLRTLDEMPARN
jgi:uncharacterized protein (DUF433 family)